MAEESVRPGTCRSKVGVEAMEEPCTNSIVPMVLAGSPAYFSNMNSRTSLPLLVQCSSPRIAPRETGWFIIYSFYLCAGKSLRRNDGSYADVAPSSPTFIRCNGCVCTRNTGPEGNVT